MYQMNHEPLTDQRAPVTQTGHEASAKILDQRSQALITASIVSDTLLAAPDELGAYLDMTAKRLRVTADHLGIIHRRATILRETAPQVAYLDTYIDTYGLASMDTIDVIELVDPSKIVQTLPYTDWGNFNGDGPGVALNYMGGLANSFATMERLIWAYDFSKNPTRLTALDGPVGPIYITRNNSALDVFTARILELPLIIAQVGHASESNADRAYVEVYEPYSAPGIGSDPFAGMSVFMDSTVPIPMPTTQDLRIVMGHIGAAKISYSEDRYLMAATSRSPWLLFPESARVTEAAYQVAYPDYRSLIPKQALASQDEFNAWVSDTMARIELN